MNDVIYQYDGSLDGFLCCVYESYVYKEAPAAFCCDEDPLSIYEVRTVITQPAYSQRVSRGIAARSGKALAVVRRGFLTCLPDKELHLYAFIRKLLAEGLIDLFSSDAHDCAARPPEMDACFDYITKKYGRACAESLCRDTAQQLLCGSAAGKDFF